MADPASRKKALEILANPHAAEEAWLGALSILDGKVPAKRSSAEKKLARFLKRMSGLTLLYAILIFGWSMVTFGHSIYSLPYILATATAFAMLEASTGLFSLLAMGLVLSSLLSGNAPYPTMCLVLLINFCAYATWNWRPYIMVPIRKAVETRGNGKLLGSKIN